MPEIAQTPPNGSFTDQLFGWLGRAVDTVANRELAQTRAATPEPPGRNTAPPISSPPAGLAATPGAGGIDPRVFIYGGAALAAVVVAVVLLRKR